MAWDKATAEDIERFFAALPADPRVKRVKMFGMHLGKIGDHYFAGAVGSTVMVRVTERDRAELLAQGGKLWEPMPGRPRPDLVLLPEKIVRDASALADWVQMAFVLARTLPPKAAKPPKASKSPKKKQSGLPPRSARKLAKSSVRKPAKGRKKRS